MLTYQTRLDGVFVGVVEADRSPLEPNVFLIPGNCVTVEPPSFSEGQQARWTGAAWVIEAASAPPAPDASPSPTRLYKASLWRRLTDDEAVTLDAALSASPTRLRRIFDAAQFLDTADADFPALRFGIVAALGEQRAAEVLTPEF